MEATVAPRRYTNGHGAAGRKDGRVSKLRHAPQRSSCRDSDVVTATGRGGQRCDSPPGAASCRGGLRRGLRRCVCRLSCRASRGQRGRQQRSWARRRWQRGTRRAAAAATTRWALGSPPRRGRRDRRGRRHPAGCAPPCGCEPSTRAWPWCAAPDDVAAAVALRLPRLRYKLIPRQATAPTAAAAAANKHAVVGGVAAERA